MNRHRYSLLAVACMAMAGLTGCVNEDYDLGKEIDTTVQLGESLSLPIKKVNKIKFCDILEIDENENLDTVKTTDTDLLKIMKAGDLYLHVQSDEDTHNSFQTEEMTFNLGNVGSVLSSPLKPGKTDFSFTTPLNVNANDLAYEIRDLEYVECENLVYSLALGYENKVGSSPAICVDELNIELPADFQLKEGQGYTKVGNKAVFRNINLSDGTPNTLKLNIGGITIHSGEYTCAENENDYGKLTMNKKITLSGRISGVTGIAELEIKGTPQAQDGINVKMAKGVFRNKKDAIQDQVFEVGELPDFLGNEGNKLFIGCPIVKFGVSNDLNFPIEVLDIKNLMLQAVYADGSKSDPVIINNLKIQEDPAEHVFYSTIIGEEQYKGKVGVGETYNEDLKKIISKPLTGKIAEKFVVTIKDTEIKGTVIVQHKYEMKYELTAPLLFRNGTHIEYEDQLDGWNEDVADIELRNKEAWVEIGAEAVSTLPCDFTINGNDLYFIDAEGNKISQIKATVKEGACIKANATTKMVLRVEAENLEEALKQIDGVNIHFTVDINGNPNTLNNSDNAIQFQKLHIGFSGPIVNL